MNKWIKSSFYAVAFLCLASVANAQSNQNCIKAATSGNLACVGAVDTTGAYQENLPTAAGTSGQIKKNTGSNNTSWVNQSSLGWVYLACTPTLSAVSTGTAETIIGQCTIPGGLMSANSQLRISFTGTRSPTGTNADIFKLRIGSAGTTSDTQCETSTLSTSGDNAFTTLSLLVNLGSASSNQCGTQPLGSAFGGASPINPNVPTGSNFFVTFTGTPGVSGDTLTGVQMSVEYLPSSGGQ